MAEALLSPTAAGGDTVMYKRRTSDGCSGKVDPSPQTELRGHLRYRQTVDFSRGARNARTAGGANLSVHFSPSDRGNRVTWCEYDDEVASGLADQCRETRCNPFCSQEHRQAHENESTICVIFTSWLVRLHALEHSVFVDTG